MTSFRSIYIRYGAACFLSVIFALAFLTPGALGAQETAGKVVRVGWYDSSFNSMDASGRRSGYAYEYQLKVASYAGWKYEYVSGSWSQLMKMLEDGQIDLMSDVSYTPEREENMLFSDHPMGTEEYYLFIAPGNKEILPTDPSSLDGKKIGVNKGSVQAGFYTSWAEENDVRAHLTEVTGTEDESLQMLETGELDAYVTVDSFTNPERAVPVFKIGSSDFYFAVNRNRPDLQGELNLALNRLQDENRYYNQQMFTKYFKRTGANAFLSNEEVQWLSSHGPVRVGYQDNYLAFCAADPQTGDLTGVLRDYLEYASDCLANVHIDFEAKAYPTAAAALDALREGEVDCMFPANLTGYDGEEMGLVLTPSMIDTEMFAILRDSDKPFFDSDGHVIVAVNEGNPNYDAFLLSGLLSRVEKGVLPDNLRLPESGCGWRRGLCPGQQLPLQQYCEDVQPLQSDLLHNRNRAGVFLRGQKRSDATVFDSREDGRPRALVHCHGGTVQVHCKRRKAHPL